MLREKLKTERENSFLKLVKFWEDFKKEIEKIEEIEVEIARIPKEEDSKNEEKMVLEVAIFRNEKNYAIHLLTAVFYNNGKASVESEGEYFKNKIFHLNQTADWEMICRNIKDFFEEFL